MRLLGLPEEVAQLMGDSLYKPVSLYLWRALDQQR
jgi:hypothetical protein